MYSKVKNCISNVGKLACEHTGNKVSLTYVLQIVYLARHSYENFKQKAAQHTTHKPDNKLASSRHLPDIKLSHAVNKDYFFFLIKNAINHTKSLSETHKLIYAPQTAWKVLTSVDTKFGPQPTS